MPFKTGDSEPQIISRATIARIAKERGLSLTDDQVQVIERFLKALIQYEGANDVEFLKSLGIRL
jgi:hypothetical protein